MAETFNIHIMLNPETTKDAEATTHPLLIYPQSFIITYIDSKSPKD